MANSILLFFVIGVAVFAIIVAAIVNTQGVNRQNYNIHPTSPIVEKSHEWHEPKGQYGENHADMVDDHIVPHPQPEPGYIVLNGIKRKLEDCKWL